MAIPYLISNISANWQGYVYCDFHAIILEVDNTATKSVVATAGMYDTKCFACGVPKQENMVWMVLTSRLLDIFVA